MATIPNAIRNPTLSILAPGAYLTVWVQNVGADSPKSGQPRPEIQIARLMDTPPSKLKNKDKSRHEAPALRVDYVDADVPYLLIRGCGIYRRVTVH